MYREQTLRSIERKLITHQRGNFVEHELGGVTASQNEPTPNLRQ